MSKKQGKSKKNVFGLVSKLGSFIKKGGNNPDNAETSGKTGSTENETPRKNFNIQISDDNLEVFAIGDEEEEEEEDEEENEVKDKKDKKEKEDNKEKNEEIKNEEISTIQSDNKTEEKIDNNINKNEKIQNIENEKKQSSEKEKNIENNNNIINTNKEEKEEKNIIKNNINEENKENIDMNNIINTKSENIINENNKDTEKIKDNDKKEYEIPTKENIIKDNSETCHLYMKKGNDFNSNEIYCYPIIRNKKKKSVFQKIGFFKKPKYDLVKYLLFFDEYFIYLSKDIIIDKRNVANRRINNILKIKNIINYSATKEQNNYHIIIEIINKNGIIKNKELFIEEKYFNDFDKEIKKSLKLYGGLHMNKK